MTTLRNFLMVTVLLVCGSFSGRTHAMTYTSTNLVTVSNTGGDKTQSTLYKFITGAIRLFSQIDQTEVVYGRDTDTYTFHAKAGSRYYFYVEGDGDSDLDLYVYDCYGNIVLSDTDNTDLCLGSTNAKYSGTYTVKVKNEGSYDNKYKIIVM